MVKYTLIALLLAFTPFFSRGQAALSLAISGYGAHCNGSADGSAKVAASGGIAPYTYRWSPVAGSADTIGGLAAGVYSVTVTDSSGATASGTISIAQPAPLAVSIDSIVVRSCFFSAVGGLSCGCGNTLWAVVSGGTPPYTYLWGPGGATGDTLHYACYEEYNVTVTDANNCLSADSLSVDLPVIHTITSGISQVGAASSLTVYPNPAAKLLTISIPPSVTGITRCIVYNMKGEEVSAQICYNNAPQVTLDVSTFPQGGYLLRVTDGAAQHTTTFSVLR